MVNDNLNTHTLSIMDYLTKQEDRRREKEREKANEKENLRQTT
jgi:hypothetical protein